MTVAIGARFPWGRLRKVVTSLPGSQFPEAIILMADSRWTYDRLPPEEMGQKVWPLAPERGIGAVFAGDVRAAEEAFGLMAHRLESGDITPQIVASLASSVLTQVYDAHLRRRKTGTKPESLTAIVGMANRRGQSAMISFSHSTGFRPVREVGVVAGGWPTACNRFLTRLALVEDSLLPNPGNWELDPSIWAMQMAAHLYHGVIEPGEEPFVGGHVQFAVLSQSGWMESEVSTTSTPDLAETWERVTIGRDKLKRYHEVWTVPRLASGKLDFGFRRLAEPPL